MVGSFSSTNKTGKARVAAHLRVTKNPRKRKQRFGCGMQFSEGRSRIFTGGELVAVSHTNPKSNLAIAQERSVKVSYAKQHPQSMVQHFSNSVINKQATSKIWSLYSFEGFLLYIRDIGKITKVTTFN